jgi:serine protease
MFRRRRATAVAGISLVAIFQIVGGSQAQQDPPPDTFPLLSSPDDVARLIDAAQNGLPYVPGEVLIKFKSDTTATEQERALSVLRSRPTASNLRWSGGVAIVDDPAEPNSELAAQRLAFEPEIEYAEPNYLYRHQLVPNDPSYSKQWNFPAIGVDRAWDINPGARNITVAVIDYGVTTVNQTFTFPTWDGRTIRNIAVPFAVNPELPGPRLLAGRDFAFWTGPVLDMEGHATHVSATIAEQTNNGVAEAGIAYSASILPLKACLGYWDVQFTMSMLGIPGYTPLNAGGCTSSNIAAAVRFAADSGAAVINISLGGPGASSTIRDALVYATQRGAFIAIAMGNEYEEGNPIDYPAAFARDLDGVVAVAAVGRSLKRAYYSNTGSHTELAAPGGDDRDGGSAGLIWQGALNGSYFNPSTVVSPRFDQYTEIADEGTSMATPHVAGTAALLYSQGVTNPAAIEALLEATALDLGAKGRDNEYGFGLIQPRAALRGFGVAR